MPSVNKLKLVADAIAAQVIGGYTADSWMYTNVEAMTKVWQGIEGTSSFFFGEEDAREATGAYARTRIYQYAETLWRTAQVRPHETKGYRAGIREFVVDLRTPAAVGICRANGKLGSGSLLQYYIAGWQSTLRPTGREHVFPAVGFPSI